MKGKSIIIGVFICFMFLTGCNSQSELILKDGTQSYYMNEDKCVLTIESIYNEEPKTTTFYCIYTSETNEDIEYVFTQEDLLDIHVVYNIDLESWSISFVDKRESGS